MSKTRLKNSSGIEQGRSYSVVIAATNHFEILDPAFFRRFHDVLHYDLSDEAQIATLLKPRLARTVDKRISWSRLAATAAGLIHADISRAADEALKDVLINSRSGRVEETKITAMLEERRKAADGPTSRRATGKGMVQA